MNLNPSLKMNDTRLINLIAHWATQDRMSLLEAYHNCTGKDAEKIKKDILKDMRLIVEFKNKMLKKSSKRNNKVAPKLDSYTALTGYLT